MEDDYMKSVKVKVLDFDGIATVEMIDESNGSIVIVRGDAFSCELVSSKGDVNYDIQQCYLDNVPRLINGDNRICELCHDESGIECGIAPNGKIICVSCEAKFY